jgi:hypothetical protein
MSFLLNMILPAWKVLWDANIRLNLQFGHAILQGIQSGTGCCAGQMMPGTAMTT